MQLFHDDPTVGNEHGVGSAHDRATYLTRSGSTSKRQGNN